MATSLHPSAPGRRFNPRPPLLAGEWSPTTPAPGPENVSIHARHCWRANGTGSRSASSTRRFQSTPAIAGGRMRSPPGTWCSLPRFQSTPAIAGGRMTTSPAACFSGCRGFNPRPPLLAGEWGAVRAGISNIVAFQSTPAIAGGRMAAPRHAAHRLHRFNPRPPLLAGECLRA